MTSLRIRGLRDHIGVLTLWHVDNLLTTVTVLFFLYAYDRSWLYGK